MLRLDQVSKAFRRGGTTIQAVSGVSVEVTAGECVGIVGESGSGKSTLGRMALMLCRPDAGHVSLGGTDLGALSRAELRRARTRMQLVFQEPYQALNPQLRARQSVAEPLQLLLPQATRAEVRRRTDEALRLVGLDEARANRYPQNLSGGELQRVGIARAIALRPALIVLDEPTSSLDLTIRAEIVALLQRLQSELNMSYLFISHDLSTIEFAARRVYVMYRGRVVESGPTADVLSRPDHPYTRMLAAARLDPDPSVKPAPLPAAQPDAPPAPAGGCAFAPRCERRSGACAQEPGLLARPGGRDAACWHPIEPAADPVGQAGR